MGRARALNEGPPGGGAARESAASELVLSEEALARQMLWFTALRVALVSLLFGAAVAVGARAPHRLEDPTANRLYGIIAATYLLSLLSLLALRGGQARRRIAWIQLVADVIVVSAAVYHTGGAESVFASLYYLAVVHGAVVLHRSGALVSAALSSLLYGGLAWGLNARVFPDPALTPRSALTPVDLGFDLFANASAFVLVGALASYLSEQLRRTGERLSERERSLARLSELHESVVRSISSGVVTVDWEGSVTYLNPAAVETTGVPSDEATGRPLEEVFPPLAQIAARPVRRGEIDLLRPDGEVRRLGVSTAALLGPEGEREGFAIVFADLTSFRRLEDAVRRAERLAAVGEMAAGLAHELRNPLASMTGSIELLRAEPELEEEHRRLMAIVLREAERLNRLVEEFLTFARPAEPRRIEVDLAPLVEETLRVFRNETAAHSRHFESDVPHPFLAAVDPAQIRQVLYNLLSNAVEATPAGGHVRIVGWGDASEVALAVEDSGAGFPPEAIERAFDPFYTTKDRGTGLGLAIVQRIADAHGGRIEVENMRGGGARVMLFLPSRAALVQTAAGA